MKNNDADLCKVIVALGICSERDRVLRTLNGESNCTKCPYYGECDKAGAMTGEKLKIDAAKLLTQYGMLSIALTKINNVFDLNALLSTSVDIREGKANAISVFDKEKNELTIVIKR